MDTLFVSDEDSMQRYNFMRTKLLPAGERTISTYMAKDTLHYPGARIILFGPVDLKIQSEKFKFIELADNLDYYAKKDIISVLKDSSFNDSKKYAKEHFEIDYIFAKSTKYQKESTEYEKYSIFHLKTWWRFMYNATMGLGYRPFRLACCISVFIILFATIYYFWIPQQINRYILKKYEIKEYPATKRRKIAKRIRNPRAFDIFINCTYFSSMLFFTFRLKGDLLASFDGKERWIIVLEYLIGLLIYIAFLTLSKAGSILHNLKSLFVG